MNERALKTQYCSTLSLHPHDCYAQIAFHPVIHEIVKYLCIYMYAWYGYSKWLYIAISITNTITR